MINVFEEKIAVYSSSHVTDKFCRSFPIYTTLCTTSPWLATHVSSYSSCSNAWL